MKLRYLILLELAKHPSAQPGPSVSKICRAKPEHSIGPHLHQSAPDAEILAIPPPAESYDQTVASSIARMPVAFIPISCGATQEPAIIAADFEPESSCTRSRFRTTTPQRALKIILPKISLTMISD